MSRKQKHFTGRKKTETVIQLAYKGRTRKKKSLPLLEKRSKFLPEVESSLRIGRIKTKQTNKNNSPKTKKSKIKPPLESRV